MSMDRVAWSSLYNITRASSGSKPFSKETLKRVFSFARPHRGKLIAFVLLSIVMAFLAVATPVLAGQVVDEIIAHADAATVIWLAVLIAIVAVAEAGLGLVDALAVLHDRRRRDPGSAHQGLRPRPEDADRVLHPDPDRARWSAG